MKPRTGSTVPGGTAFTDNRIERGRQRDRPTGSGRPGIRGRSRSTSEDRERRSNRRAARKGELFFFTNTSFLIRLLYSHYRTPPPNTISKHEEATLMYGLKEWMRLQLINLPHKHFCSRSEQRIWMSYIYTHK